MNAEEGNKILNVVGLRLREMSIEEACVTLSEDKREGQAAVIPLDNPEQTDYTDIVVTVLRTRLFGHRGLTQPTPECTPECNGE